MLSNKNLNENLSKIRNQYRILNEQEDSAIARINPIKDIEKDIEQTSNKKDKQQSYKISGNIITLHGKEKNQLELTSDEKSAFQETMNEFKEEVSELVDFEILNLYTNNVEWGGQIYDLDIKFYYTIGENNGIYINGDMIKADDEFLTVLDKLKIFYEKFKSKWGRILANRKLS
jgi:gamma-glutamylcyclotransferase (GGCT)/AIG2-like uncharacterized protein YtfP